MKQILMDCYQALQAVPAVVTRGWPQAELPLPHIQLSLMEDRLLDSGERMQSLGLRLRAASPEAADDLAEAVDAALQGQGLGRRGCLDGVEHDRGSFLKIMRFDRLLPPEGLPAILVSLNGHQYAAKLLGYLRQRAIHQGAGLWGGQLQPLPGQALRAELRLQLPLAALANLEAAWQSGAAISYTNNGQTAQAQLSAYSLADGLLDAQLSLS